VNLILFLGSGVSRPAGMPMVDCLTDSVLDRSYWKECESGGDYFSKSGQHWDRGPVHHVQQFLQNLFEHKKRFLNERYIPCDPSYEDLYYLCSQIQHDASVTTDRFIKQIKRENITLFRAANQDGVKRRLADFASLGMELIERVVWEELRKQPKTEEGKVVGFDLLREILHRAEIERIHIITLNHDTLVERVLQEEGVSGYTDGFGRLDEKSLRWYEPNSFFSESQACVSLIKLHGSINWFLFDKKVGPFMEQSRKRIDRYAIANNYSKDVPNFLTGTDKELIYNSGIFADMYEAFINALRQSQRILMSGFGWNDRGISLVLKNWLERDERNRLLLLHKDSDELRRFQINGMNDYGRGQILRSDKWFCETGLGEVLPHLT